MGNYEQLKKAIADVIKTNGNEEITGAIMQRTLISIVNNLGSNAQFAGVAVPSTVPADTDGSVFYLASTQGTYPNFSGIEVDASEMAVFTKNTAGTWVKTSLPIQHPTIKKPLLIGGNVAAVTKGTGVVLSVPTLNADGTETASELSIEAATPANNGAMTKEQVNTLKEVDDFYTRMTDFVVGDNDDTALINIEAAEQNSINLKYKTLDTVNGSKVERTKTIPAVNPVNGTAGAAGMDIVHDIPYFFDFYRHDFTSLPGGSDITNVLIPKFRTSYDGFDGLYTNVPVIQNKVFANPKAGDRILMGSLSGVSVGTVTSAPLWATVTSAQRISGVYSVTVDYDGDTYIFAYTTSNNTATLKVPWSKISSKRNVYINEIKQLSPEDDETRIKEYLTPQVYYKYNIVYPVKPQTGDLVMEYHRDELRYVAIKVVRNQENPDEYTDILIPESGTANAYTRIVLKNDLTAIKSRNPYYILKTCKRAYDGDLLLALDTVKAETIENSITKAYSFSIEGRNTQLAAQLPEVGDLIETYGEVAPVCEVLLDTDSVQHTRWFSDGKLYEVTVNTALTRVPEDPKVIYDTTSGTLRDLYISAGAVYNERTGYYELNGLTDITEVEMRKIYKESKSWAPSGWMLMSNSKMRTNLPITGGYYTGGIGSIFENCPNIEVINMMGSFGTSQCVVYKNYKIGEILVRSFRNCPKLKKIMGILNIGTQTDAEDRMFELDIALESVKLKGWQGWQFSFKSCPNISKESILYLINNSSLATSAIGSAPIELHPTAYARLKDDADIVAALEAKGGIITLVSA